MVRAAPKNSAIEPDGLENRNEQCHRWIYRGPVAGADPTARPGDGGAEDDREDDRDDEQLVLPAPAPAPVPAHIAAACRARLCALHPAAIAAACNALDAAVRGLPVTGGEPAAVAAAAQEAVVISLARRYAPREVTRLMQAHAALEYRRLQMCALGQRLGQAGATAVGRQLLQQRARWAAEGGLQREAGGVQQPAWGAAELLMALAAARRAELTQAVQAAERALAEAQRVCAAAHAAQEAIVGRLPLEVAGPAAAEDAAA